jgi:hypothetical protein
MASNPGCLAASSASEHHPSPVHASGTYRTHLLLILRRQYMMIPA